MLQDKVILYPNYQIFPILLVTNYSLSLVDISFLTAHTKYSQMGSQCTSRYIKLRFLEYFISQLFIQKEIPPKENHSIDFSILQNKHLD